MDPPLATALGEALAARLRPLLGERVAVGRRRPGARRRPRGPRGGPGPRHPGPLHRAPGRRHDPASRLRPSRGHPGGRGRGRDHDRRLDPRGDRGGARAAEARVLAVGQPGRPQRWRRGPRRAPGEPPRDRGPHLDRRGLPPVRGGVGAGEARAPAPRPERAAASASPWPTTAPTSSGWQLQPRGGRTVQGTLEEALARLAGGPRVVVAGAGRTDAGVHALGQVASFELPRDMDAAEPPAGAERAAPGRRPGPRGAPGASPAFHARKSAVSKLYRYELDCGGVPLPLRRRHAAWVPRRLDESAVAAAAALFVGPPRLLLPRLLRGLGHGPSSGP